MSDLNDRIFRIDFFIQKESTGSRNEFADRLGVSNATLHNTINYMKKRLAAPIAYDTLRRTYYYTYKGTMSIGFNKDLELRPAFVVLKLVIEAMREQGDLDQIDS